MGYILTLPDDWKIYLEELARHFKDGIKSITSGVNELIVLGYITRTTLRDEKGKFKGYMYDVFEVSSETPKAENGKAENRKRETTNYLSLQNNNNILYNQSISPEVKNNQVKNQTDRLAEISIDESYIKNQVGYNSLIQSHDKTFVDEVVLNILDMYFKRVIRIKGEVKPQCIVHNILSKLTHWHVVHVITRYNEVTIPIKNKTEYIQTMLYNSVLEMSASNLNEARSWSEAEGS